MDNCWHCCTGRGRTGAPVFWLALAVSAATVTGCGFQLRGQALAEGELGAVLVQASGTWVGSDLRAYLGEAGVESAESEALADLVVRVHDEHYDLRVLTVDADSGKAIEYAIEYRVSYSARRANGESLIGIEDVNLFRDYVVDPEALLGASFEASVIREEMRRDAIQQIVGRLARLEPG